MKLISLNTWGGRVHNHILSFFEKYHDTDIFLLQEVYHHGTDKTAWHEQRRELFTDIGSILETHQGYFAPAQDDEWGLAMFIKKEIPINEVGDVFVYRWKNAMDKNDGATLGKNIQYFKTVINEKKYTFMNFHGLWNGQGKTDTADRLMQSKNIKNFINAHDGDNVVLCGDFNLMPDTESLAIIAEGMQDLIREYGITSTRSHYYPKEVKFADYALVSPDIHVKDFKVLDDAVSDHLPLYLDFT